MSTTDFETTNQLLIVASVLGYHGIVRHELVPELARAIMAIVSNDPDADVTEVVVAAVTHRQTHWQAYGWGTEQGYTPARLETVGQRLVTALAAHASHERATVEQVRQQTTRRDDATVSPRPAAPAPSSAASARSRSSG